MTRKSISLRGVTYDALRKYADMHGESMSEVVEKLLAPVLGLDEVPYNPRVVPQPTEEAAGVRDAIERREQHGGVKLWG